MKEKSAYKKVQRLKLMMIGTPVKFDASIVAMDEAGAWMDVVFDGPLAERRLHVMGDSADRLCEFDANDRARLRQEGKSFVIWKVV